MAKKAGHIPEKFFKNNDTQVKSTIEMVKDLEEKQEKKLVQETKEEVIEKEEKEQTLQESKEQIKMSKAFEKILKKEEKKPKKLKSMIYLEEETMLQFKTLAGLSGKSLAELFEFACEGFIKGQEIDMNVVAEYDKKRRGKKTKIKK